MNDAIRKMNEYNTCLELIAMYPVDYWMYRLEAAYKALENPSETDRRAYFVALVRFARVNPLHFRYADEPGETPMETRSSLGV